MNKAVGRSRRHHHCTGIAAARLSDLLALFLTLAGLAVGAEFGRAQDSGAQALLTAAQNGAGSAVQSLLEKGISPNARNEHGLTPLHLAAGNGHQATVETLLHAGADINAVDNAGQTALDLAIAAGHSGLAEFLQSKGAVRKNGAGGSTSAAVPTQLASPSHMLKPTLRFKTVAEFEREIAKPAVLLDSTNVCFFAPKRRETEARIVFPYLVKAYETLYQIVGTHTDYKMVVYAFPKGNTNGWGGTSECSIEYDDSGLELGRQPEWTRHHVPHVSGYIEEMAHNFVSATKAQFGWEMIGWSLGALVSQQVAGNPILTAELHATREGQRRTFNQYVAGGYVFPKELPANQCDRIHAWILYQCASKYGPHFWPDFFREVRSRKQALSDAVRLGDGDKIRNARYRITLDCFDQLPGIGLRKTLMDNRISLTTDVKSLHPEARGWNRRLSE
jgi:hypothetical protein